MIALALVLVTMMITLNVNDHLCSRFPRGLCLRSHRPLQLHGKSHILAGHVDNDNTDNGENGDEDDEDDDNASIEDDFLTFRPARPSPPKDRWHHQGSPPSSERSAL